MANQLITRSWRPQRLGCVVFTGRGVRRGSIDCAGIDASTSQAIWRIHPVDEASLPTLVGNYLDAEAALLGATAEMDAIEEQHEANRSRCHLGRLTVTAMARHPQDPGSWPLQWKPGQRRRSK